MPYGTVNADVIGTSVAGSNIGAGNASIMKNRIINGGQVIDQRNAGASVALTSAAKFITDRFAVRTVTGTGNTAIQSTTSTTGFVNSLLVTIGTGASPAAGENNYILQSIEGFNISDLGWGTANAKTVTLSFQVRSSLTGTFGGALRNSAGDRSYPYTYTIASTNTWTPVSVTIAGDTSGTWLTNNGEGVGVFFDLGTGSTFQGTAGAWAAADYRAATGCVKLVATSSANLYITGVQLEVGSSATGFEYRQYTTELQLCQRYYQILNPISIFGYFNATSASIIQNFNFPVLMRSAPTVTVTSNGTTSIFSSIGVLGSTTTSGVTFQVVGTTAGQGGLYNGSGNAAIEL
jgi:hypothetical protein